jgi:hypothetical protein
MGMVVERNPNRPFLLKSRLLKVVVLFAAKITWAWPKNKGDAAPFIYGRIYEVALIRITPVILEICPDLSQRVNPDKYLPITRRTQPEEEE